MIDVARLHAQESGAHIDYLHGDAAALAAAEARTFDVVTCMELVEHVPDPAALMLTLASCCARAAASLSRPSIAAPSPLRSRSLLPNMCWGSCPRHPRVRAPGAAAELASMARSAGLALADLAGLHYNPLSGRCTLDENPDVNYLAQFIAAANS